MQWLARFVQVNHILGRRHSCQERYQKWTGNRRGTNEVADTFRKRWLAPFP